MYSNILKAIPKCNKKTEYSSNYIDPYSVYHISIKISSIISLEQNRRPEECNSREDGVFVQT